MKPLFFFPILLLCLLSGGAQALCPSDKYWTPDWCPNTAGSFVPYTSWRCKDCPANAVQYVSPDGLTQMDESCMCKAGFAVADRPLNRCSRYAGDFPTENPPIPDTFTCNACDSTKGELCRGGVEAYDCSWIRYYTRCDALGDPTGCPSWYKKVECPYGPRISIDHSYKEYCLIFGQTAVGSACRCPANTYVEYREKRREDGDIWHVGIVGDFLPPEGDSRLVGPMDSTIYLYNSTLVSFGFCQCAAGYYRDESIPRTANRLFFTACQECPIGSYCAGGDRKSCAAGWTTAGPKSTSAVQCNVCQPCPLSGSYCPSDNSNLINTQAGYCPACPPGSFCASYQQTAPVPCTSGYQCPDASMTAPRVCSSGSYSPIGGAVKCTPCAAGTAFQQFDGAAAKKADVCDACGIGYFQDKEGQATCKACSEVGQFQDETRTTSCKLCPAGYMNSTGGLPSLRTSQKDVCTVCDAGKFNARYGYGDCDPCPQGFYSDKAGATACTPCAGNKITSGKGATSAAACYCPDDMYDAGSGTCAQCGRCRVNEGVTGTCMLTSNVKCELCKPCLFKRQYYVNPATMCSGFSAYGVLGEQQCIQCKTPEACKAAAGASSSAFYTLFSCQSGETSHDTSVCVSQMVYKHPLEFQCDPGSYLDAMNPSTDRRALTYREGSRVYLGPDNAYTAEVLFAEGGGVVRIFKTKSVSGEPLVPVSESGSDTVSAGSLSATPAVWLRARSGSQFSFTYTVSMGAAAADVTFTHPMNGGSSSWIGSFRLGVDRVIASGVWSQDGSAFFVIWMDGTISRIGVAPKESRTFVGEWSPAPASGELTPLWSPRQPSARVFEDSIQHQCVAVPTHPTTLQASLGSGQAFQLGRQIQLICMYAYYAVSPPASYRSYLVRVLASGERMPVDLSYHATAYASSSLYYDVAFNTIYVSTYASASYSSGRKHVLKVCLSPSYNYRLDPSSTTAAAATAFVPVMVPTNWTLPGTAAKYPAGLSLDYAAVEPQTLLLLFYVPTMQEQTNTLVNVLHYIPIDDFSSDDFAIDTGERSTRQALPMSAHPQYGGSRLELVNTVYSGVYGAQLVFTLNAGLFMRFEWLSGVFYEMNVCASCPAAEGWTSARGSVGASSCHCEDGVYYYSAEMQRCVPARQVCAPGEFVVRFADRFSDIQCFKCPSCPQGYYRDPNDCVSYRLRDPTAPPRCLKCAKCATDEYILPERCSPDGTTNSNPASDCAKCKQCGEMESVLGASRCSGETTYDTQTCRKCSSSCPLGTTISRFVSRCRGTSWAYSYDDLTAPFDPDTECDPCPACPSGSARVGGCTGKAVADPPLCASCGACPAGTFIAGQCSLTATGTSVECMACPECERGKYLARRCSGQMLNEPDHVCEVCAKCPMDHYIGACTSTLQTSGTLSTNLRPADAGVCIPCKKCVNGSYISKRCDGTKLFDDSECAPCATNCPTGTYKYAQCNGSTFAVNTNDCRPCTKCNAGQFMSSGLCTEDSGGATSPNQRTCSSCFNCYEGEYIATPCSGFDIKSQAITCEACSPCPEGYYLSQPCDGFSTSPTAGRVCTPCQQCQSGYYRVGCGAGSGRNDLNYDDSVCRPCTACPDGHYISRACPGGAATGTSPLNRTCTRCEPCAAGQYMQQGCGGVELIANRTCAPCGQRCPVGQYVSRGACNGTASLRSINISNYNCAKCNTCPGVTGKLFYISVPCPGTGFSPLERTCAEFKCPVGCSAYVASVADGVSIYKCRTDRNEQCAALTPAPATPAPTPVRNNTKNATNATTPAPTPVVQVPTPVPTPTATPAGNNNHNSTQPSTPAPTQVPTVSPTPKEPPTSPPPLAQGIDSGLVAGSVIGAVGGVTLVSILVWRLTRPR